MIRGDAAAEEVFFWTKDRKAVDRRGAGPIDASIFGRGAGEGFGVHICTGPIHVKDAEPGDVIEVRIDDMAPRPSRSPGYEGDLSAAMSRPGGATTMANSSRSRSRARTSPSTKSSSTATNLTQRRFTPIDGLRRSIRSASFTGLTTIPASRSTRPESRLPPRRKAGSASRCVRTSALSPLRRGKPIPSIRFRRPISAAISTIGALARARLFTCRSRSPAASCRSAIRMRPRAMARYPGPRSNAR